MRFTLCILLAATTISAYADSNKCPVTKNKEVMKGTTVFVYQTKKNNKIFYVPFAKFADGKLSAARETLLPTDLTIFNLRDNKALRVNFENVHDNVDYDVCRSIGKSKDAKKENIYAIFATQPMANAFTFTPSQDDINLFDATLPNPCKAQKAKYDKHGITSCNADKLIATSQLNNQKQYWHTKQYRYDVGFAVNVLNPDNKQLTEVIEDCAVCSD